MFIKINCITTYVLFSQIKRWWRHHAWECVPCWKRKRLNTVITTQLHDIFVEIETLVYSEFSRRLSLTMLLQIFEKSTKITFLFNMRGSRCTVKNTELCCTTQTELCCTSLHSKVHSPPHCCPILLDLLLDFSHFVFL